MRNSTTATKLNGEKKGKDVRIVLLTSIAIVLGLVVLIDLLF